MSLTIWIIIGIIFVLVWVWLIWEFKNTPLSPDDYNNFEKDDFDIEKQQLKNDDHDVACCDDDNPCECGMRGKSMFSKNPKNKKQK